MTEQIVNSVVTTLIGSVTSGATSLVVASAAGMAAVGTYSGRINDEIVTVTARTGTTLTVTRGAEGTTADSHMTGSVFSTVLTAGSLNRMKADIVSDVSTSFVLSATDVLVTTIDQIVEVIGNTTSVTVTLPAAPRVAQRVGVLDGDGHASSYQITVDGNGKLINGNSDPLTINIDYSSISFFYDGLKWVIL